MTDATEATERRGNARRDLDLAAKVRTDDYRVAVAISDVSEGGCRISTAGLVLHAGGKVSLRIEGFESFQATVRWYRHGRAGLSFDRALYAPIVDHLHRENPRQAFVELGLAA